MINVTNFNRNRGSGKSTQALLMMNINPSNTILVAHTDRRVDELRELFFELTDKSSYSQHLKVDRFHYEKNFMSINKFLDTKGIKKRNGVFDDCFISSSIDEVKMTDKLLDFNISNAFFFGNTSWDFGKERKKLLKQINYIEL